MIGKTIIAHVVVIQNGNNICLHVITLLTNNETMNIIVKISFSELLVSQCTVWCFIVCKNEN